MANQAEACDTQFGGRISLSIGGQQYPASDGDIKMTVSNYEVSTEMNSDGTLVRKVKLVAFKWEITFRERSGIVWQANMMACSIDATCVEQDNNRTHLMTSGTFTGSPVYNTATGELSGVAIEGGAGAYQRL
jgi:hypothetical protein